MAAPLPTLVRTLTVVCLENISNPQEKQLKILNATPSCFYHFPFSYLTNNFSAAKRSVTSIQNSMLCCLLLVWVCILLSQSNVVSVSATRNGSQFRVLSPTCHAAVKLRKFPLASNVSSSASSLFSGSMRLVPLTLSTSSSSQRKTTGILHSVKAAAQVRVLFWRSY